MDMATIFQVGGSCNTIDNLYAQLCFPNNVKNINVKVFHLISGVNEIMLQLLVEQCNCKCRLNESVCSWKKKCNNGECRCQCI